jgi:hypothetical protein
MKTKTKFQQRAKVGVAGSFHNQLMSNNATLPEVGKGATELHYTDRTCYEVIEVSEDKMTVKLERLEARIDPEYLKQLKGGDSVGHQNWVFDPTGQFITVVWRQGAWRIKVRKIKFTKDIIETAIAVGFSSPARILTPEQHDAVYANNVWPQNVVDGITRETFEYPKIKLLFGVKDYYYDWSF